MNQHKQLTLRALEQMRGDDLARARYSFRGLTAEAMQLEHGCSGRTRAQILAEYEAHDAKVTAAIAWLKGI